MDIAALNARIAQINALLPAIGQLCQTAHVIAPNAAGVAKANLVIGTVIALEPALSASVQVLSAAVSKIVDAYKSEGVLPQ